jgi:CubicO group peptidase (beta-lactamase class C family)
VSERRFEDRLREVMAAEKVPGLAFAVVHHQEIVHAQGLGVTSTAPGGYAVTPETLFRIGSVTKALTGTAILRLVDAGKLDLDAPLTRYIPWLELSEPGTAQRITVRMLLTHTSGLPTDTADRGARDPDGLARFLRTELPRYPLVAPPGLIYNYSNLGFCLLGHVAEVVTGQAYQDLMNTLVLAPLQMKRTTFDPTLAMSFPLSQSHRLTAGGELYVVRPFADNAAFAPAGFAFSTVLDLANFARMHLAKGQFQARQFLSSELISEMHTLQVPTYSPGAGGRGLALFVDPHPGSGLPRVGHMGGITGYRALFELYPTIDAAIVLVMNRAGAIGKIRDVILEECLGVPTTGWHPTVVEPDRAGWRDYAGTYLSDTDGFAEVRVEDDRLVVEWNGERFAMDCHSPGHYVSPWRNGAYLGAGFVREPDGHVNYLMLSGTPFRRVQPAHADLHPATWKRYEGAYALKQPPMTVRMADGTLFLHSAFYGKEVRCVPLSNTAFACQWGRFSFQIGHDGCVEGIRWAGERFIPKRNSKS